MRARYPAVVGVVGATAALVLLFALVIGVPAALWALVGWPLPRALPTLAELRSGLEGGQVPDAFVVKGLALACWVAWAQVVACTVAEVTAWARGRGARRVPLAGPVQLWVRRLVAASSLAFGTGLPQLAHAGLAAAPPPLVEVLRPPSTSGIPAPVQPATTAAAPAPAEAPPLMYTVQRRDCLWDLAERHLGDPFRWRELFELNRGRPQPDGSSLRNPDLLRRGWTLRFPADATGLATASPQANPEQPPAPVSTPQPAPAPAAPALEEPPPEVSGDVATTAPEAAPSTTSTPVTTTAPEAVAAEAPRGSDHEDGGEGAEGLSPLVVAGGGLAAAGVVVALDRLRRVQQRHRRPGRRVRRPSGDAVAAEVALRAAADLSSAERLDRALRWFGVACAERRVEAPPVVAVQLLEDAVELLLKTPLAAPLERFTSSAGGLVLTLSSDESSSSDVVGATTSPAPMPALASLGNTGSGTLLVDLEHAGLVSVTGNAEQVQRVLDRLAIELATSLWADHVEVIVVGDGHDGLAALERVRIAPSLGSVVEELEPAVAAVAMALEAGGHKSTIAARLRAPGDGWVPTVVVCSEGAWSADPLARERLVELARSGGRGLAAVVPADVEPAVLRLRADGDDLLVEPLGVRVRTSASTDVRPEGVEELFAVAADRDDLPEPTTEEDADVSSATATKDVGPEPTPAEELPFEVEVALLGPVEVRGGRTPIERGKSVELVAYLALHSEGVTDGRLKTALWPDALPSQGTFNTTVTVARGRLGVASDGSHHLPHLTGGRYRVGSLVTTDLARFQALVRRAQDRDDAEAVRLLRSALDLVRGQPFESVRGYEWAHSEGLIAHAEALVADAAHRLAELCVDRHDPAGAQWAAARGLRAAPGYEVLYRDRMLAFDLAGDPGGVETVMDELCAVVEALEPYDDLHPETVALYERLSHRRRRTG